MLRYPGGPGRASDKGGESFGIRHRYVETAAFNGNCRRRAWGPMSSAAAFFLCLQLALFVQPHLLVPPIAVDAVGSAHVSLHIRLAALCAAAMQDDRAGNILVQNAFDLPYDFATLGDVGFG